MDNNLIADYTKWEKGKDYPEWMSEVALSTISKGYLLPGETPRKAYRRVASAIAERLGKPELVTKFFKYIWNGWLGLASPVISNTGTDRGLPISCFGVDTPDSIRGIGLTNAELMKLTAAGGGVGVGVSRIRPRGEEIRGNGKSEGVVPWCKIYDSAIIATNQGNVRRGAASVNCNINHPDIDEFLKSRVETGEPYIMFEDNVNKDNPLGYMMNNLNVSMTNICTEITLHTDEEHSFICCLSSVNLAKYDEWKDTDLIETSIYFLDGVMQEFIDKTNGKSSMKRTHKHAKKGRALGLGVMGWHTFLQKKNLPFNSIASTAWTHTIMSQVRNEAEAASRKLAEEYGEPLWCKGTGMRNTHLLAIAPTVSNSRINGCSAGIEPEPANVYTFNGAKGTFIVKNKELENLPLDG
jgi:ribonucleoside-diphosphate reductase alpha chain